MSARVPVLIVLSGEPQGKGRPRFVRSTGHAYTPSNTRKYEDSLRNAAGEAMGEQPPFEGPVSVVVVAILPIPASWSRKKRDAALAGAIWPTVKPDWENIAKMLDAFNEIVWRDDRQVVDGRVVKRYGDRPRLIIEVREISIVNTLGDEACQRAMRRASIVGTGSELLIVEHTATDDRPLLPTVFHPDPWSSWCSSPGAD